MAAGYNVVTDKITIDITISSNVKSYYVNCQFWNTYADYRAYKWEFTFLFMRPIIV